RFFDFFNFLLLSAKSLKTPLLMKRILLNADSDKALEDVSREFPREVFKPANSGRKVLASPILHYHTQPLIDIPWLQNLPIGNEVFNIPNHIFDACSEHLDVLNSRRSQTDQLAFSDFINSIFTNAVNLTQRKHFRDSVREYLLKEMKSGQKEIH